MGWNVVGDTECSVAKTLAVVGDGWTMLIIRELFSRTRRFDEFLSRTGISSNLLTQRLNRLVDEGVVEKVLYQRLPARHEYRLTQKGLDLYPLIIALKQWGDRWCNVRKKFQPKLKHKTCGASMTPIIGLTCSSCGAPISPRDITLVRRSPPVPSITSRKGRRSMANRGNK